MVSGLFCGTRGPADGNAQRHELDEIVMIALLATVCGAEGCVDMALFGRSKGRCCGSF